VDVTGSVAESDCIECVAGTYSDVTGTDEASDCIDCPQGRHQPTAGQSDCMDCVSDEASDCINWATCGDADGDGPSMARVSDDDCGVGFLYNVSASASLCVNTTCDIAGEAADKMACCEDVLCPALVAVSTMTLAYTNVQTYDSVATYTCNDAMLAPNSMRSRACLADGSWGGSAPAACQVPPRILVVGGQSASRIGANRETLNTSELYDSVSDSWSPTASMESARMGHAIAALPNGIVVVAGGYSLNSGDIEFVDTAEAYDVSVDAWSPIASMNVHRGYISAAVAEGRVYVFGGFTRSDGEVYDPTTDNWAAIAPMSTDRDAYAAVTVGGNIYVMGGRSYSSGSYEYLNSCEVYNVASNSWSSFASMPPGRYDGDRTFRPGVAVGTSIYIGSMGLVYDTMTDAWSSLDRLPPPRSWHAPGFVFVGSSLVMMGGQPYDTADTAVAYDGVSWSEVAPMGTARANLGAVVV
jgi:hypothetical protein